MKKRFIAIFMAALLVFALAACAGGGDDSDDGHTLRVAVLDGGLGGFPVWVAEHKGWFEEAGITIDRIGFTNGPVQMEAIDSWDIGLTGIGGILSGTVNFGAPIIGMINTDDGTQYIFAQPDSPVALAGPGNSPLHPGIYGDAESWSQMTVNSTFGTVLHLLLLRTLESFGLGAEDIVQINWMDMPTSNAALLGGQGDASCVSGDMSFMEDKENFVAVSNGNMTQLGLRSAIMANPDTIQNESVREATLVFLRVFFDAIDWIHANQEEAAEYLISWGEFAGRIWDTRVANIYLEVDTYYTLARNHSEMHTMAPGGYPVMVEPIVNILRFFIDTEVWREGDDDIFLRPEHFDTSFIDALVG